MTKTLYAIKDYPSGAILDVYDTRDEAREAIQAWEEQDMLECVYQVGSYYIDPIIGSEAAYYWATQCTCTTDCLAYARGVCPYAANHKSECPKVRQLMASINDAGDT